MATPATLSPAQTSQALSLLRALCTSHQAIDACALVTSDGRVAASVLGPNTDRDRFGAMCASLIALAARAVKEAERGELLQVILEGRAGPVLLTCTGEHGVLAVAATPECPLGRVLLDTRKAARSLTDITGWSN